MKELEVTNRNLVETMKSKDVFLTGVSHELRNPLNSLRGSIDIIQETQDKDELKEYTENARTYIEILL